MFFRLLMVEPDEEVLSCNLSYFNRIAEFKADAATNVDQFADRMLQFIPHVLLLEPAFPDGPAILDVVEIPVIVLSRFYGDSSLRSHPAITDYYVKPQSLVEICQKIRQIVTADLPVVGLGTVREQKDHPNSYESGYGNRIQKPSCAIGT